MKMLKKYDKPDKIIVTAQAKVKFDYKQINLSICFIMKWTNILRTFWLKKGRRDFNWRCRKKVVIWLDWVSSMYFSGSTNWGSYTYRKLIKLENKWESRSSFLRLPTLNVWLMWLAKSSKLCSQYLRTHLWYSRRCNSINQRVWATSIWTPSDLILIFYVLL